MNIEIKFEPPCPHKSDRLIKRRQNAYCMPTTQDFCFQGFSKALEIEVHGNVNEFSHILVDDDKVQPEEEAVFKFVKFLAFSFEAII